MKKIALYIVVALVHSIAYGQIDRSTYPEPGPAPQINIGDPATFTLPNGLTVFVVENHKLPRVSYTLVLDRDPVLEGSKAGTLSLAGDVLLGGTQNMTKVEFDEALDRIGARIQISDRSASASSLKKYNDQLLTLFGDALFRSAYAEEELTKLKKQMISSLALSNDDPSSISKVVANAVMYGKDHPYGEVETAETIQAVEMADIKNYFSTYFRPNIAYLAIVGDITVDEARQAVTEHFGAWEKADVPKHTWSPAKPASGVQLAMVDRATSQQSVINVQYPADMKPNNPDVIPASVVSNIFGGGSGRLFLNLREDKGYTYGAYGSIRPGKLNATLQLGADVGTAVTDSAINEMLHELTRMADRTITSEELTSAKAALSGRFARSLEQPATIANFAINTALDKLPKDYYANYLRNLDAVDLEAANKLAEKYVQAENLYITVVGQGDQLKDKLAAFGTVNSYTKTGDPVETLELSDASITAEQVIDNYLDAIGGKEKAAAVKTMRQVSQAEIQGMALHMELLVDKSQGIAIQNVKMGDNVLSKTTVTEEGAKVVAMGQTQDLPEAAAVSLKSLLDIFPELAYTTRGVQVTLDGLATVEGAQAYKIKTTVGDMTVVDYYLVSSGLKVQSDNPNTGTITYKDYTDYNGVLFPRSTEMTIQGMPITAILQEVQLNVPVEVSK